MTDHPSTNLPHRGPGSYGIPMPKLGNWRKHDAVADMVAGYSSGLRAGLIDVSFLGLELSTLTLRADPNGLSVKWVAEPTKSPNRGRLQEAATAHMSDRDHQVEFASALVQAFDDAANQTPRLAVDHHKLQDAAIATHLAAAAVLTDNTAHAHVAFAMVNGGYTGTTTHLLAASRAAVHADRAPTTSPGGLRP